MKITRSLNDNWTMRTERFGALPCSVPCSLYSTLLAHGKIENPYYRENEYISTRLCDEDCVFETVFDCTDDILAHKNISLTFEGIDTIADVFLNGVKLGSADNMHRIWQFDIKSTVAAHNTLTVHICSPNKWIADRQAKRPLWGVSSTMPGYTHMRKAHCMFGWDWGPMLPDMGIWRGVTLSAYDVKPHEIHTYFTQKHEENRVTLRNKITAIRPVQEAEMKIYSPDGILVAETRSTADEPDSIDLAAVIENPELWWANGCGKQPLYTVKTVAYYNGSIAAERTERIGLRTLTVSREKDEWGEEFCFMLNGKKIFAMGANYIPEDQIVVNCTKERTRRLLKDCAAANYNCIRVWGGGYYPDEYFYDVCDELGLIVWQDFMFACSAYLLTEEFESTVRRELTDNIYRLRNHASLGLWCGNNEIESAWEGWGLPDDPQAKADYLTLFEQIIPDMLKVLDPERFYHPSSPSSGGGFDRSSSNHAGDMHYWDVWHNLKPIEDFRKYYYRFCSEYGFESVPSMKTMRTIANAEKGDFDLMSPVMEAHQKCEQGTEKMMYYLAQMVRYPYSFEELIYSSQLLQADCIRSNVEHMRRARGRCMGSMYWQVNDSNPVISWSSIDYYGRWKALHYYAKRFYAPVLLSLDDSDISALRFNISSERLTDFDGEIHWNLRNNKSEILDSGSFKAHTGSLSCVDFPPIDLSSQLSDRISGREKYLEYELIENGETIGRGTTLFVRPKTFDFLTPNIKTVVHEHSDSWTLAFTADVYVKSVCLDFDDRDAVFEDNWFDIHGGKEVQIVLKKSRISKAFDSAEELKKHLTIETVNRR